MNTTDGLIGNINFGSVIHVSRNFQKVTLRMVLAELQSILHSLYALCIIPKVRDVKIWLKMLTFEVSTDVSNTGRVAIRVLLLEEHCPALFCYTKVRYEMKKWRLFNLSNNNFYFCFHLYLKLLFSFISNLSPSFLVYCPSLKPLPCPLEAASRSWNSMFPRSEPAKS